MAIFHLSVKIFRRDASIIARSAYRSGSRMTDHDTGKTYDYRYKKEVTFTGVMLCAYAPLEYMDREKLWESVQQAESGRRDCQIAREIEVAFPKEYDEDQQKEVLEEFIRKNFTDQGMIADYAIHNKDGNPHAHILLTMRPISKDGSWSARSISRFKLDSNGNKILVIDPKTGKQKRRKDGRFVYKRETIQTTDWNDRATLARWRKSWADINNRRLREMGIEDISEKSNKERGKTEEPTVHEGYRARKIEKKGGKSDRCETNRRIRKRNRALTEVRRAGKAVGKQIARETLRRSIVAQQIRQAAGQDLDGPQMSR